MFALYFILTVFTSIMTSSYGQLTCASGWELNGEKCYQISPGFNSGSKTGDWNQCNSYCQKSYQGATMLCVQDEVQNTWLLSKYGSSFWIGYTDMPPYGGGKGSKKYGWVTGCSSGYTNWYSVEPNNYQNNEDCTQVWTAADNTAKDTVAQKWNDADCTVGIQCGCQYTPVTVAPSFGPTAAPSTNAPSTIAPSSGPSIVPSTAPSSISPTTLSTALVPAIQLPTCPIGWTLHCSCQWTDKRDHAYQDSSPIAADSLSWDAIYNRITVEGAVVGSVVTLIVVAALYACTRSVKDLAQRSEYAPIVDRE